MKEKKIQKFRFILETEKSDSKKETQLSEPYTINDLLGKKPTPKNIKETIQYLGFKDAKKQEIYEGDIIELKITDELMGHNKRTFYNSNLGKAIEKAKDISSVICLMLPEKENMGCHYQVYFDHNGYMEKDENNEPEREAFGTDYLFPAYLCQSGAAVTNNILINTEFFNKYETYDTNK